jgi:branched-chain amino acid transport system permease protein
MTPRPRTNSRLLVRVVLLVAGIVLLAMVPYMAFGTFGILPGAINSPGSMQILTIMLVIGALAVSYDIVFGYTGLLSFGHALFFAVGGYAFAMTMRHTDAGFLVSVLVAVMAIVVTSALVNAVALRATGMAFAMVTLAFSQLAYIVVSRNYVGTGGEEGLRLPSEKVPDLFLGVLNAHNAYWLALSFVIVVTAVASWAVTTRLGRAWQAIRENDLRVAVMGINVYAVRFTAGMLGSVLAGLAGIVYVVALGGADPAVTELFYSLGLLIMLVIGGVGRIWGALLGGVLYTLLVQRLPTLTASDFFDGLPKPVRSGVAEPEIILGVVFIIFIFAMPGGLAELLTRRQRPRPSEAADQSTSQ